MRLIVFLLFLTSCYKSDYINTTDLILAQQSKKICKEENMSVCGMGGAMMNKVTKVTVAFQAKRRVDIPEARRLIVKCVEKLRNALNSNDQIQAYLSPYPFSTNGVNISIMFLKDNDEFVDRSSSGLLGNEGVSAVIQVDGKVYYPSHNPRTQLLEDYYEETYEEALEIVRNNGSINPPCNL